MSLAARRAAAALALVLLACTAALLAGCGTNARALVLSCKTTGIEFPAYGTVEKSHAGEGEEASVALVEVRLDGDAAKDALEKELAARAEPNEGVPVPDMGGHRIRRDLDGMETDCSYRIERDGIRAYIVLAHDADANRYLFYFQS